jgi:hypothetical protein
MAVVLNMVDVAANLLFTSHALIPFLPLQSNSCNLSIRGLSLAQYLL